MSLINGQDSGETVGDSSLLNNDFATVGIVEAPHGMNLKQRSIDDLGPWPLC